MSSIWMKPLSVVLLGIGFCAQSYSQDETAANPPANLPFLLPGKFYGLRGNEEAMILKGFALANTVLPSACFEKQLRAAKLTSTQGHSVDEILAKLRVPGREVPVEMFTGNLWQNRVSGTVGWERDGDPVVHMNRYFVTNEIWAGSNLLHEVAHIAGYSHESADESTSVPYTMNSIFEFCVADGGVPVNSEDRELRMRPHLEVRGR